MLELRHARRLLRMGGKRAHARCDDQRHPAHHRLDWGTSVSAAIITGVVAAMQGITKAKGKPPLSSADVKAMFKDPALTSDPAPGQGVGRMPNLGAIVTHL
jgi:hypothetical protein